MRRRAFLKACGIGLAAVAGDLGIARSIKGGDIQHTLFPGLVQEELAQPSIILLGDSITQTNNAAFPQNRGFWNWANVMLGQKFRLVGIAGVGGNRTDQMLARISGDVLKHRPDWCMVMGGVNDVFAGTDAAIILANLSTIWETLHSAGIGVIASTITACANFDDRSSLDTWFALNQGIRDYAAANGWMVFGDAGPIYRDASLPGGAVPLTGYTVDGTHPNALGAAVVGKKLCEDIKTHPLIRAVPAYSGLAKDNSPSRRLSHGNFYNPLMAGTGGSLAGRATGVVADGWIGSGGAWSPVRRTDPLPGVWQQAVSTAGATLVLRQEDIALPPGIGVGDTIFSQCEFQADDDWVGPESFELYLAGIGADGGLISFTTSLGSGPGSGEAILNPMAGVLKTPDYVIPTGVSKIRIYARFRTGTSGTVRFSRYETRKK